MDNLGSLPNFIKDSEVFDRKFNSVYSKQKSTDWASDILSPKKRSTMAESVLSSKFIDLFHADNRPEGFTYVSEHKDIENLLRISSANASKRPKLVKHRNKSTSIEKPVVASKISCNRDPKENIHLPQKSVKMQEKIRNELL